MNMPTEEHIFDTYEILAKLGQGSTGVVYKARHLKMGNIVALKTLHAELLDDPNKLQRFRREAKAAAKLDHPAIVKPLVFSITDSGTPFIVYEYVEGETLADYLKKGQLLSDELIFSIVSQLASALEHAHHNGVIHRDVKPANVVINLQDEGVRLLDFGIATILNSTEQRLTATAHMLGTPAYMSPEQCSGKPVDARSDLYSLGCVLYEMLSGTPPFEGATAFEVTFKHINEKPLPIKTDHAHGLNNICLKLLEKAPEHRYQSASQLCALPKYTDDKEKQSFFQLGNPLKRNLFQRKRVVVLIAFVSLIAAASIQFRLCSHDSSRRSQSTVEWSDNILPLDKLHDLIKAGKISEAHRLYMRKIKNFRRPSNRTVLLLNQLATELVMAHEEGARGVLEDELLDINALKKSDSQMVCAPTLALARVELHLKDTTEDTYHRLVKALKIALKVESPVTTDLALVVPKFDAELMENPALSIEKHVAYRALLSKDLNFLQERLRHSTNPNEKLDSETMHWFWSNSSKQEHALEAAKQLILVNESHPKTLTVVSLILVIEAIYRSHNLPRDLQEKVAEIAEQFLEKESRSKSWNFQLRDVLSNLYALSDEKKAKQLLLKTIAIPEFGSLPPIERASFYHKIAALKSGVTVKEKITYGQAAFDLLKTQE